MTRLKARDADTGSASVAGWLAEHGVEFGDRVAVAPPRPSGPDAASVQTQAQVIVFVYGCLRAGVTPVMVNPFLADADRQYVLQDCQPRKVVGQRELAEASSHRHGTCGRELLARPMHYTSGTTGVAKGVWAGNLDPELMVQWWADEGRAWPFDSSDATLVCGPLVHSAPLRFALLSLAAGGDVVLTGTFNVPAVNRALADEQPTTAFMVPTHAQRILGSPNVPTSPFRLLAHAGAACPAPLKRQIHEWAGVDNVWEFYGSTEGQFTQCRGAEWEARPGTLGRARTGRELLIDDGTVWCVAPDASKFEYWNDPARTAQAWRELPTGRHAFSVGDLGHLDDDGYLFFDGRRTDLIITGGVNVYPTQVENTLSAIDGVDECAAFGVEDDEWGQVVCLAYTGPAAVSEVAAQSRRLLAKYQVPKQIVQLEELPRTATGKIRRIELPQLLDVTS